MTPAHSVGTKDGTSVVNPKSALKEAVELADALVNELLPDQGSGGSWAFALALKLQASVASQAATLEAMASALETMRREFCNPMVRRALDGHNEAQMEAVLNARTTLSQYRKTGDGW